MNFIFLITLNKDIKKDFNVLEAVTNEKINVINNSLSQVVPTQVMLSQTAQNQGAPTNQNQVREVFNSFGDHFSGLAYVNNRKTDMSFDENTTAFTFPPLYSFEKIPSDDYAASSDSINNIPASLRVLNQELYYRGKKIKLPNELKSENILNINVSLIGSRWLVGIVTGKNYDERGFVYFYDPISKNFSPLITATTAQKIMPNFERLGGTISFGGTVDDFLIVYGAYDGHIFYYHKGNLTDVSRFFGLRVSSEGFTPQIISTKNSRGTVFYICSQSAGKPKLIKLWPKRDGELMGSLDFSPLIFKSDLGALTASCELEKNKINVGSDEGSAGNSQGIKILVNLKNNDGVNLETYRFTDNGFDNSKDREVSSVDIGQNRGRKILTVIIPTLEVSADGLNDDANGEVNSVEDANGFAIFLANKQPLNWEKIKLSQWAEFNNPTESLFWRATFKSEPQDPDYSPWFDQINQLNYMTI